MKLIKPGQIPEPPKPWWIGRRKKCESCGAVMELEACDEIKMTSSRGVSSGIQFVEFNCNFCAVELKLYANDADPLNLRPPVKRPSPEGTTSFRRTPFPGFGIQICP